METFTTIQCPFCGQRFDLALDASIEHQTFTTDCEICCRPFEVTLECDDGEVVDVQISGN